MSEEIQLLQEASFEIKNLRRQNELMQARLEMFDNMMLLANGNIQQPSRGMSPDVVWAIDKFITKQKEQNG